MHADYHEPMHSQPRLLNMGITALLEGTVHTVLRSRWSNVNSRIGRRLQKNWVSWIDKLHDCLNGGHIAPYHTLRQLFLTLWMRSCEPIPTFTFHSSLLLLWCSVSCKETNHSTNGGYPDMGPYCNPWAKAAGLT
jgi:hypothetical protein